MSLPHMAMTFFILTLWDHTPGHRGSEIAWGNRLHRIRTGLGLGLRLGSGGQRYLSEQMLPEQERERRAGIWVSQGTLEAMVSPRASALMVAHSAEQALQVPAEGDTRTEGKGAQGRSTSGPARAPSFLLLYLKWPSFSSLVMVITQEVMSRLSQGGDL